MLLFTLFKRLTGAASLIPIIVLIVLIVVLLSLLSLLLSHQLLLSIQWRSRGSKRQTENAEQLIIIPTTKLQLLASDK